MNSEIKNELGTNDIINDIKIEYSKGKCNAIWKRNCPKCYRELVYTQRSNWQAANRVGSLCRNCRVISDITKEKHRKAKLGLKLSNKHKQKLRNSWIGKSHSNETKQKMRIDRQHISDETKDKLRKYRIGRKASETTREKLRVIRLEKVKEIGGFPSFNKKACEFMDEFGKKCGFHFRHALNGGEEIICGYSVDGYDKDNNIVFEYDERRHENPTRKVKDIKRVERMINKIGCEVIRYSERFNKLYKSYPTYSTNIKL